MEYLESLTLPREELEIMDRDVMGSVLNHLLMRLEVKGKYDEMMRARAVELITKWAKEEVCDEEPKKINDFARSNGVIIDMDFGVSINMRIGDSVRSVALTDAELDNVKVDLLTILKLMMHEELLAAIGNDKRRGKRRCFDALDDVFLYEKEEENNES